MLNTSASLWSWFSAAAENLGHMLIFVSLLAILLALLGLLIVHIQTRIGRFTGRWPARIVLRPRLEIGRFDDGAIAERLGPPIAGLIRSTVSPSRDRYELNLVSGQAGVSQALNALNDVSGEIKTAIAVVRLIKAYLPSRRFVLRGELQPGGIEGVGLSLELAKDTGIDFLQTFWARALYITSDSLVQSYQQLAVAAAAWVDHQMASAIDGANLLTADPLSWVYFRAGVEAQRLNETRRARYLYERALVIDGGNAGALANLGILERGENNFDSALDLLTRALVPIEYGLGSPRLPSRRNPDWYRIKYQLAVLHANWAAATGDPPTLRKQRELEARSVALDLALASCETITALTDDNEQSSLVKFLESTIEPAALLLVAAFPTDTINEDSHPISGDEDADRSPSRAEVLALLRSNSAAASSLIRYVELGSSRSPALLYNIACVYVRQGRYRLAAARLIAAIHEGSPSSRPSLVRAAKRDPTLEQLFCRLPGLLHRLEELTPDSNTTVDRTAALSPPQADEFDLDWTTLQWLAENGWDADWHFTSDDRFHLVGRRDHEHHLVHVKFSGEVTEADVSALCSAQAGFTTPDDQRFSAIMATFVLHADASFDADAEAKALENDIAIYRRLGGRFVSAAPRNNNAAVVTVGTSRTDTGYGPVVTPGSNQ